MALGLSVIFGVVRIVNFAHGEMMSIAMYIAVVLFAAFHLDPLIMLVPIAAVMFVFGYVLQAGLINPFITRPEHSQFLLVVAFAIIIVNTLLIIFGPDAQTIQTSYAYDSFQLGPVIVDASKAYAAAAAIVVTAALFAFFRFTLFGKAIRACADNYTGALVIGLNVKTALRADLRHRRGVRRCRRHHDVADHRRDPDARAGLYAARLRHRHHRRARLDGRRTDRRRPDRADRGDCRPSVHAVGQEHVRVRHPGPGAVVAAAGHPRQEDGMIARLADGARSRRSLVAARPRCSLVLVIAPFVVNDYLLTVMIVVLYLGLYGAGLEHHDGLCRAAFARPCDLCGAGRLRCGGACSPVTAWLRGLGSWRPFRWRRRCGAIIGFLAFRFGVAGVYFAILTIAFAEFARDRLRSSRFRACVGRFVSAGCAIYP